MPLLGFGNFLGWFNPSMAFKDRRTNQGLLLKSQSSSPKTLVHQNKPSKVLLLLAKAKAKFGLLRVKQDAVTKGVITKSVDFELVIDIVERKQVHELSETIIICDIAPQQQDEEKPITSTEVEDGIADSAINEENIEQAKDEGIDSSSKEDEDDDDSSVCSSPSNHFPEPPTRADWEPLAQIPHLNFKKALARHLGQIEEFDQCHYEFVKELSGGYNYVRQFKLYKGPNAGHWIVRIPSVGTPARWKPQDAYMLRSEYATMKLIYERTMCPVPKVVALDDTLDNELGAPYMIMKFVSGVKAADIWFDQTEDGDDDTDNADHPSLERKKVRETFLQSLAEAMAELGTTSFDKTGVLNPDEKDERRKPTVGPAWHFALTSDMNEEDLCSDAAFLQRPSHSSSQSYWAAGLDARWSFVEKHPTPTNHGARFVLQTLLSAPPFSSSRKKVDDEKETFVLRHGDLNWNNILCNPQTGEVTAIIDWQECTVVPRCIGNTSVPVFLKLDWFPKYSVFSDIHTPMAMQMYRKKYAEFMTEATGSKEDGRLTVKSAMYQALYGALYGGVPGGNWTDFARKILRHIPELNCVDPDEVLEELGDGWELGEELIREEVPKVVAP